MLKGTQKLQGAHDPRLPILPHTLTDLIHSCDKVFVDPYDAALMKAVYALMFHAFLRVGEASTRTPADSHKVIQLNDISFSGSVRTSTTMSVFIRHFKHNKSKDPFIIHIHPASGSPCPVSLLQAFIHLRGNQPGPLFRFKNGSPLSPLLRPYLNAHWLISTSTRSYTYPIVSVLGRALMRHVLVYLQRRSSTWGVGVPQLFSAISVSLPYLLPRCVGEG